MTAFVVAFVIWACLLVPLLCFCVAAKRGREWGDDMARHRTYTPRGQ